ncbi:UNVERIFIED_CONTAM: dolichyl-phosphate-mannose-protein mannosyltransferase [Williamsia faeni]
MTTVDDGPRVASALQGSIANATLVVKDSPSDRGGWFRGSRLAVVIGLVAIMLAHAINSANWPLYGDDEGTYVSQSWAVLHGELAHYTYWYDHPPLGWIQLSALLAIPDFLGFEPTMGMARILMVVFSATTALMTYRLGRNVGLRQPAALVAMLLWGLSPLVVFESRQVFLDTIQLPWVIGAFVLATSGRQRLLQHVAAGACLGIAVLTKETALVLVPALLLAIWIYAYRPTRVFSLVGAFVMLALVVLVFPLTALLNGELIPGGGHVSLIEAIQFQLFSREGSGVMWDPTSLARATVGDWLRFDPLLPIAGVVAGLCCLIPRRLRPIGLAILTLTLIALRPDGYLPVMFISVVLPFAAISVAALGERTLSAVCAMRFRGMKVGRVLAAGLVSLVALVVVPGWVDGHIHSMTATENDPYNSAIDYVGQRLPRETRILADDSYWPNLVEMGWDADGWNGPIWYYKLDLDPVARDRNLTGGWQDIDYLIVNEDLRRGVRALDKPQLRAAFQHSVVVSQWGTGADNVELRRIEPDLEQVELAGIP